MQRRRVPQFDIFPPTKNLIYATSSSRTKSDSFINICSLNGHFKFYPTFSSLLWAVHHNRRIQTVKQWLKMITMKWWKQSVNASHPVWLHLQTEPGQKLRSLKAAAVISALISCFCRVLICWPSADQLLTPLSAQRNFKIHPETTAAIFTAVNRTLRRPSLLPFTAINNVWTSTHRKLLRKISFEIL